MTTCIYLAKTLKKSHPNVKVYLVGGTVRDDLINRPINDIDIVVTDVNAENLLKTLKTKGYVKLVGKSFGIYKWKPKNKQYTIDVALPRREHGWGTGRKKDFTVQADHTIPIAEDLKRRDFTINGIACDVLSKKYIDPCGGRIDIKKKIIRTIGNPQKRFQEDYSRVLRAIRLACQLNFTIHKNTWQEIKKSIPHLNKVSKEIAAEEIVKAIVSNPLRAFDLFYQSGVCKLYIPELIALKLCEQPKHWHSEGNVWKHTRLALAALQQKQLTPIKPFDPILTFAVLFHDIGKPITKAIRKGKITFYNHDLAGSRITARIIKRLKLESAGVKLDHVKWLVKNHLIIFSSNPAKMKNTTIEKYFLSKQYPSDHLLALIECDCKATVPIETNNANKNRIDILKKRIAQIKTKPKKPILNGDEVMEILKIPPSQEVGKILMIIREAELDGKIQNKEEAEMFIKKFSITQSSPSFPERNRKNRGKGKSKFYTALQKEDQK